jgi:hypothetical protein
MADENLNTSTNTAAKMWAKYGDAYFPCEEAVGKLKAGQYTVESSPQRGIYFNTIQVNTDELMVLPDTSSDKIIGQIEDFWTKKERYKAFNFVWKRGFLLWGPPGSGKTTTIQLVAKNIIAKDGICVFVKNPAVAAAGLEVLRKIEPDRPVVVILEHIDAITQRHSDAELLALLDGELQIQNVAFLATTNYPEKLDKRLVNRPSRFDVVQKIDYPNEAARRMFLLRKNPELENRVIETNDPVLVERAKKALEIAEQNVVTQNEAIAIINDNLRVAEGLSKVEFETALTKEKKALESAVTKATSAREEYDAITSSRKAIDMWVENTDKFSIAHLKELILSVELFDVPFETTVKRLRKMMDTKLSHQSGSETNI